jgi:hypothetical protein
VQQGAGTLDKLSTIEFGSTFLVLSNQVRRIDFLRALFQLSEETY